MTAGRKVAPRREAAKRKAAGTRTQRNAARPRRARAAMPTAAMPTAAMPTAAMPTAAMPDDQSLRLAARVRALDAIETLATLMRHGEKEQTRLAAALAILDRAFGRVAKDSPGGLDAERGPPALVPVDTGITRAPNEAIPGTPAHDRAGPLE